MGDYIQIDNWIYSWGSHGYRFVFEIVNGKRLCRNVIQYLGIRGIR